MVCHQLLTCIRFVSEYLLHGHYLYHGDIILLLHQILHHPFHGDPPTEPHKTLPAFGQHLPLDESGGYVLQVSVRIAEDTPALSKTATTQLLDFQKQVAKLVQLAPGDRLALDTRVKG